MHLVKAWVSFGLACFILTGCGESDVKGTATETDQPEHYELVEAWPKLPEGFELGNPTGLGIDSKQHIWVFHRASRTWVSPFPEERIRENTILCLDRQSGAILASWGADLFIMPHGLEVDAEDNIWVTDVALHQIFKFSPEGELLLTLGEAWVSGLDSAHFNLPTDVAVADDGTFYVSDGYGNSRVVKFSKDGRYLMEWGSYGDQPGQFNTPHGIDLDKAGDVYVADRENNRVQKFDLNGKLLAIWQNQMTDQLYSVVLDNQRSHLYGVDYYTIQDSIIKGSDIFRFDLDLNLQMQFGRSGDYDGPISRYHDVLVDEDGNIYVGDILGNAVQKFQWTANQ